MIRLPVSHLWPVYPVGHLQQVPPTWCELHQDSYVEYGIHWPPLKHELDEQYKGWVVVA